MRSSTVKELQHEREVKYAALGCCYAALVDEKDPSERQRLALYRDDFKKEINALTVQIHRLEMQGMDYVIDDH